MTVLYSVLHFLVDGVCVIAIFSGGFLLATRKKK